MRAQLRRDRVVVGYDRERQVAQRGRAAKIRRVRAQHDLVAALPAYELVRSRADRSRVERDVVDVVVPCEQMRRKQPERRVALREDRVDGRREAALHVHDDRVVVRRVHRGDLVVAAARHDIVARVHDRLPRKLDVATSERRAVVPLDAAPKVIRDRQAVFADAAVVERWNRCGEIRDLAVVLIQRDEQIEHQAIGEGLDGILREDGVELRRVDLKRYAQALRCDGATAGTLRAGRQDIAHERGAAGNRREPHQAMQRNFAYMYG